MSGGTFLEDYRPATFLERGVAVPFTTPLLMAARVRPNHRGKLEFVIANPSGGPGYYVMGWDGLLGLTKITVHDRLLYEEVVRAPMPTPSSIRAAARTVALSGAAGRSAARAAQAVTQREGDDRLIANFLLTVQLLRQAGLRNIDWRTFNPTDRDVRAKTRGFIERLEPTLGVKAETIFAWIEDLSGIVAPIGFPTRDYESRQQLTFASVQRLESTLCGFAGGDVTDAAQSALFIADCARLTLDLGGRMLETCYAELRDLVRLLGGWSGNQTRLLEMFGRPDWLLDGWQTICALWDGATASSRDAQRAAVVEMQRMVPVMPKEVSEWVGADVAADTPWSQRRWVRANVDWRSGAHLLDRTARNEMLRAAAA
ncbi:MAG TPA: hypothetical protein VGE72_29355 [Azospirillum sp.]